jgi:hypothetical protein
MGRESTGGGHRYNQHSMTIPPGEPGQPEDPWDTVAAQVRSLGQSLQETYRQVADEGGPSEDEVREALAVLVGAWNQVAGTVGSALQDPDVRHQLKLAATSFATAVGNTIADLGVELGRSEEE